MYSVTSNFAVSFHFIIEKNKTKQTKKKRSQFSECKIFFPFPWIFKSKTVSNSDLKRKTKDIIFFLSCPPSSSEYFSETWCRSPISSKKKRKKKIIIIFYPSERKPTKKTVMVRLLRTRNGWSAHAQCEVHPWLHALWIQASVTKAWRVKDKKKATDSATKQKRRDILMDRKTLGLIERQTAGRKDNWTVRLVMFVRYIRKLRAKCPDAFLIVIKLHYLNNSANKWEIKPKKIERRRE